MTAEERSTVAPLIRHFYGRCTFYVKRKEQSIHAGRTRYSRGLLRTGKVASIQVSRSIGER